jgi:hypothetical protein
MPTARKICADPFLFGRISPTKDPGKAADEFSLAHLAVSPLDAGEKSRGERRRATLPVSSCVYLLLVSVFWQKQS